jgi:hypothetical protein
MAMDEANAPAPPEEDSSAYQFCYFFEDGTGSWVSRDDVFEFDPNDSAKMFNPAIAGALQAMKSFLDSQGVPCPFELTSEDQGAAEPQAGDADDEKRRRKEEKRQRKEAKKAEKAARKEEKRKRKREAGSDAESAGETAEGEAKSQSEKKPRKSQRHLDEIASPVGVVRGGDLDDTLPDLASESSESDGEDIARAVVDDEERFNYGRGIALKGGPRGRQAATMTDPRKPSDFLVSQAMKGLGGYEASDWANRWSGAFAAIENDKLVGQSCLEMPRHDFIRQRLEKVEQKQRFRMLCEMDDDDFEDAEDKDDTLAECKIVPITLRQRYRPPQMGRTLAGDGRIVEADTTLMKVREADPKVTAALSKLSLGGPSTLATLHTEGYSVMSTWLRVRDQTGEVAPDIHALPAFGAVAKKFDYPQQLLLEASRRYSMRQPDHSMVNLSTTRLGDRTVLDLKAFSFDQTRQLEQHPVSEQVNYAAPSRESSVFRQEAESSSRPGDVDVDALNQTHTLQSEDYQLQDSAWHIPSSNPYPQGSASRPYSRNASEGRAASFAASRRGTDSWRLEAAKVVTRELTPFLRGKLGKPVLISSEAEFKRLAKKLTERALERKMHRSGQTLLLARASGDNAEELEAFSAKDALDLSKAVRNYMENFQSAPEK